MLETLLLKKMYDKQKREGFKDIDVKSAFWVPFLIALIILIVLCSIWAAYLSWKSNSMLGWGPVPKVIFAVFAFWAGVSYLLSHLIHKLDLLLRIERGPPPTASSAAPQSGGGGKKK